MDDKTKKDRTPDEVGTDTNSIAETEHSAEEAAVMDMFEGLPSQEKKLVSHEMVRMMGVMKQENPIIKKITSEHIDKFLEGSKLELQEAYKEKHERKLFIFGSFIVALIFIFALAWLLKDKEDLLEKILYTLGGLVAGAFGGYGYGKKSSEND